MDTQIPVVTNPTPTTRALTLGIFGIGNAGAAMIQQTRLPEFTGAKLVTINTDNSASASGEVADKILLETRALRGMGTGGDPERGRTVAEEHLPRLKESCAGLDVVFVVVGLGGGAGTGISPVLARAAKESGALVIALVTLPFDCEGTRRQSLARQGLEELRACTDAVICLANQRVFRVVDENISILASFQAVGELLVQAASGMWRLLARPGLIPIHVEDICAILRQQTGDTCFASAEASGESRAQQVMDKVMGHALLDGGQSLTEAEAIVVSVVGGTDLTMADVNRVMARVKQQCSSAQVIMGAAVDESFANRLSVTLIATRAAERPDETRGRKSTAISDNSELSAQLLDRRCGARPASRYVPPAPTLSDEQRAQFIAKQSGSGRSARSNGRLRQGTLPLEIVAKGRFDKGEPTIHKGEDLDVPTYIRRGVALN